MLVHDKEGTGLKYNQVITGIKHHIKKINDNDKVLFDGVAYNSGFDKIKFLSDDGFTNGKVNIFSITYCCN